MYHNSSQNHNWILPWEVNKIHLKVIWDNKPERIAKILNEIIKEKHIQSNIKYITL